MWLKLDGENIIGFTYDNLDHTGYDVHIEDIKLVFVDNGLNHGKYKYKWSGSALVIMDQAEIDAHPVHIRAKVMIKIEGLLDKENKKEKANKYKEVKKDPSLSDEEIAIVDEIIAEIEA